MNRLFALREHKKGPLITDQFGEPLHFDNKMAAKQLRDRLGGRTAVTFGPDHKLYGGEYI